MKTKMHPMPSKTGANFRPPRHLRRFIESLRTQIHRPHLLLTTALFITIVALAILTYFNADQARAATLTRVPVAATFLRTAVHHPLSRITVTLAPVKGTVTLAWYSADSHAAYLVGSTGIPSTRTVLQRVTNRVAVFRNLNEEMPYLFTITPITGSAAGPRSTVLLRGAIRTLRGTKQLSLLVPLETSVGLPANGSGSSSTIGPAGSQAQSVHLETSTVPNVPQVSPGSAVASSPQNPPVPSTPMRTILECPAGYSEIDSQLCRKTMSYTFERREYTYSWGVIGSHDVADAYAADIAQSTGTYCPWGGSYNNGGLCVGATFHRENDYGSIKDPTPAGYTDTGSDWRKKDPLPSGFTDDGVQWIKIVAKIATEVPA